MMVSSRQCCLVGLSSNLLQNLIRLNMTDGYFYQANLVADYAQELGCTCVKTYKMDARKALWDGNQPQQSNGNQQIHNEKVIARMIRKAQRRQLLNQQPVKEVQPAGGSSQLQDDDT